VARYPRFAGELTEFFGCRAAVERVAAPLRRAVQLAATSAGDGAATHVPAPILPSDEITSFGDYELLDVLGEGAMGVVYRARQTSLGRPVALKMIRSGRFATPAERHRFRLEAETAAALDHPGIVPLYEVGEHGGRPYFTMKLIDGGNLSQFIARKAAEGAKESPLRPLRLCAQLLIEVARAVHHAHQRGVLHRDLKPSNILLDAAGRPHVTDFGLAKRTKADDGLTQIGAIVGTPSYMAPEQAGGENAILTTATDIHGLGAILYALLTGRPPFAGDTFLDTLAQVKEREPQRPGADNKSVDCDLETVCLKCLEKDPARRYGSAEELAQDLERWLTGKPVRARPVGRVARLARWCRRNRLVAGLGATLAAILVVAAAAMTVSSLLIWQTNGQLRTALADADELRALALERQRDMQLQLYVAHIREAQRALEALADPKEVRRLLAQDIPRPGEPDLRDFEWHYLWRLSQRPSGSTQLERIFRDPEGKGEVYCVAVALREPLLATAGQDGLVRIWDWETGSLRRSLRGHTSEVNWAAFSPDGTTLASAGDDGVVKPWDVATGQEKAELVKAPHKAVVTAFSPDGKLVAACFDDGTVHCWDLPARQERAAWRAHEQRIEFLAFSPDGKVLATASESLKLCDVKTGCLQETFAPQALGRIQCVAFAHFSPHMALTNLGASIIRDRSTLQSHHLGHDYGAITRSLAFSLDDRLVAQADERGAVRLWDTRSGQLRADVQAHDGRAWCVAFSPHDGRLATAGQDGTAKRWHLEDWSGRKQLWAGPSLGRLAFSPDGSKLAIGYDRGQGKMSIDVYDRKTWSLVKTLSAPLACYFQFLTFSPDGQTLAASNRGGIVSLWDLMDGQQRQIPVCEPSALSPAQHLSCGSGAAFAPDGRSLYVCGPDGVVRLLDMATGRLLRNLTPPTGGCLGLFPSSNGQLGVTRAPDGAFIVWDLNSGRERVRTPTPQRSGLRLAVSPDGRLVAQAATKEMIELWDVDSGQQRAVLLGHHGMVLKLEFSPDGKTLASCSEAGEIKLWNIATGQELLTLAQFPATVASLAFSPDGRHLGACVSPSFQGSGPSTAYVWSADPIDEPPAGDGMPKK
jgi:WD40 repeat protein/tRNA A-37 threonylcarbamoyl transferase component Bud32